MPIVLNGSGPVTGVTSLNTTVSDTEIGFLDGVTSAIQTQINGAGGLVKITDATFSAQSTVSVNNCFSASYRNYRLIFEAVGSTSATVQIRMRVSGADNSSANYHQQALNGVGSSATATSSTGLTYADLGSAITQNGVHAFDIFNPQIATPTQIIGHWQNFVSSGPSLTIRAVSHNVSTAYDGFTLIAGAGTMTGNLRVYGYRD